MGRSHLVVVLLAALLGAAASPAPDATLVVQVQGLRNAEGQVRVSLFRTPDGWPEAHAKAARTLSVRTTGARTTLRLEGLAPGTYALAVLHDENENEQLDRNFLGVPREGIGASNDATRLLGAPIFDQARFELAPGERELRVSMRYY